VKKRKRPNRIAAAGKISSTMPPVDAPAPEPWANAGEINIPASQQAEVHNGNTRIKRFMIFAAIHGLMVLMKIPKIRGTYTKGPDY
jgi:hypothetical protein